MLVALFQFPSLEFQFHGINYKSSKSCKVLPNLSSAATFVSSPSKLYTRNTLKYAPSATLGFPFSIWYKVERCMPARSETYKVVSFRCLRANFIFSPNSSSIRMCLGNRICFLVLIVGYFQQKHKICR